MFKRINFRYCVPLVLFSVFAVTLSLVHSQNVNRQTRVRVVDYSEEEIANIRANAEMQETIQMLPTAQRVLLLSTETLDESFRKLATYDDGQYFEPGYTTNRYSEDTTLKRLLSNRRVIKIMQEFEKLPLEQARAKAKELHQVARNNLARLLHGVLGEYQKSLGQESAKSTSDYEQAKFMILTSLLLSASLGDVPLVIQQIDDWEQIPADIKKQAFAVNYPQNLIEASSLQNSFYFDATSFVSILMFAMERKGPLPETIRNKVVDYKADSIPLVAWNANKTYFDDISHSGNDSFSWEDTQIFFTIYDFPVGSESSRKEGYDFFHALKDMVSSLN